VEQRLLSDMSGAEVRSSWRTFRWNLTSYEARWGHCTKQTCTSAPPPLLQALMSTSAERSASRELVLEETSGSLDSRVLDQRLWWWRRCSCCYCCCYCCCVCFLLLQSFDPSVQLLQIALMREQTQITPYFLFPSLAQTPGISKPEEPEDGEEILVSVVLHCSNLPWYNGIYDCSIVPRTVVQ